MEETLASSPSPTDESKKKRFKQKLRAILLAAQRAEFITLTNDATKKMINNSFDPITRGKITDLTKEWREHLDKSLTAEFPRWFPKRDEYFLLVSYKEKKEDCETQEEEKI